MRIPLKPVKVGETELPVSEIAPELVIVWSEAVTLSGPVQSRVLSKFAVHACEYVLFKKKLMKNTINKYLNLIINLFRLNKLAKNKRRYLWIIQKNINYIYKYFIELIFCKKMQNENFIL
jgi:hypothetical protein